MSPKVHDMYHQNLFANRNQTRYAIGDMIRDMIRGEDYHSEIRLAEVSSDQGQGE